MSSLEKMGLPSAEQMREDLANMEFMGVNPCDRRCQLTFNGLCPKKTLGVCTPKPRINMRA